MPNRSPIPANAGKPWTAEDDAYLESVFVVGQQSGQDAIRAAAEHIGRTRFGVENRLIKLGIVQAPPAWAL